MPWPEEKRAIDIGSCETSHARATELFGFEPRTALAAGLAAMIEYYRHHRSAYWGSLDPTPAARPIGAAPPHERSTGSLNRA